jgi:hypothetical protein
MKRQLTPKFVQLTADEYKHLVEGKMVTIPLEEYRHLKALEARWQNSTSTSSRPKFRVSKIRRDPELEAYVKERLQSDTLVEIVAACLAKFGPERAPSKSALQRFIDSERWSNQS